MSDIINILPDSVANQIAAGEVVDRPASAVKELLENAMDAGATSIQLIVKDAGRSLIQVIDNGCGMSDSDARLCFERHATSKIHKADDLFAIRSMGFRGEALASIAAVAQVEMKTRQHDNELGTMVVIEASDVKEQSPCTCPVGTSIAVKNLFFNIPARRNFLKKDSIELSHIEEIFKRIALVNYKTDFTFHHNGKLLYDLRASNFAQRIAAIFGSHFKERLYPIEEKTEPVSLFGYVGKAEYAKRARGEQYIFVNGRYIKHPFLSAAIEKAYTELIPERSYPSYFVMLEVDPMKLDVNIHPTKTEVRFVDESIIFAILRAATKKALGQFSLATQLEFNPATDLDFTPAPPGYTPEVPKVDLDPTYNPFSSTGHSTTIRDSHTSHTSPGYGSERNHMDVRGSQVPLSAYENFFGENDSCQPESDKMSEASHELRTSESIQFASRYIITTLKSGLVIIDQQRAHERIIYERLMDRRMSHHAAPQQLMFPVNCRFNAADSELLKELTPTLSELGFILSPLGQNTFVVTATPPEIKEGAIQELLEKTIADYKGSMVQKFSDRDQSVCLSMARNIATRQGSVLKAEEMQQLIADLFSCQAPNISPSGKPTMFIMGEHDIADKLNS